MAIIFVGVNEIGRRVGESHHNARLTDHDVGLLLGLRYEGWSYLKLAKTFEISKGQVRNICKGRRRCQTVTEWRKVHVKD